MSIKKVLISIFGIIIVIAATFVGGIVYQNRALANSQPTISSELIASRLTGISELASLEYAYTNVGKFENQQNFYGWKVPLTTKNFIITYDGVMKMGIKGEGIKIDVKDNKIIVSVPDAEILSHEIKEDSVELFDQSQSIFNQILITDYTSFASDRKKDMEQKAIDNGLLEDAQERAKEQLALLIGSILGNESKYELVFK